MEVVCTDGKPEAILFFPNKIDISVYNEGQPSCVLRAESAEIVRLNSDSDEFFEGILVSSLLDLFLK